jgi:hypothetical protein
VQSPTEPVNYKKLAKKLEDAKTVDQKYKYIVDLPFEYHVYMALMFLGIIVLLLIDEDKQTINRIALSDTKAARDTKYVSVKDFHDIKIPLNTPKNVIAKAVRTGKPQNTDDWKELFSPALSAEQARLNQASGGIAFSAVYPVAGKTQKGALIFSYYQYPENIGDEQIKFMKSYSQLVAGII